jgi:hypothetical protein
LGDRLSRIKTVLQCILIADRRPRPGGAAMHAAAQRFFPAANRGGASWPRSARFPQAGRISRWSPTMLKILVRRNPQLRLGKGATSKCGASAAGSWVRAGRSAPTSGAQRTGQAPRHFGCQQAGWSRAACLSTSVRRIVMRSNLRGRRNPFFDASPHEISTGDRSR